MPLIYESARVSLHHGDATEVLERMPSGSVELLLTDPPYGKEWQSTRRAALFEVLDGDGADTDARAGVAVILRDAVRLIAQRRHLYVFGPADVLDGLKISATADLVWDKARTGMGDLTSPWGPAHEPITFAVSHHSHAGEVGRSVVPVRMRKGSVLSFAPPTGRNVRHPSEKPVGLLRELIESSTRAGDLVLDPFAGVGSTGVAAILTGRRAVLVEIREEYAMLARDRLIAAERLADAAHLI